MRAIINQIAGVCPGPRGGDHSEEKKLDINTYYGSDEYKPSGSRDGVHEGKHRPETSGSKHKNLPGSRSGDPNEKQGSEEKYHMSFPALRSEDTRQTIAETSIEGGKELAERPKWQISKEKIG